MEFFNPWVSQDPRDPLLLRHPRDLVDSIKTHLLLIAAFEGKGLQYEFVRVFIQKYSQNDQTQRHAYQTFAYRVFGSSR